MKYRCQSCHQMSDFKAKMHQIRFPPGVRPRPHCMGSLAALPRPLAVFNLTDLLLRGGREKAENGKRKENER